MQRILRATSAAALLAVAPIARAAEPEGVPVGLFGAWAVMTDGAKPPKVCFAVAAPQRSEAQGLTRQPAFLYLSTWPKDGLKAEISLKMGYALHKGSEATLLAGDGSFKLFPSGERLYVADPVRELKLLETLKKAPKATVVATSEKGVRTTDTFSLAGLDKALQALAKVCP